MLAIPAAVRRVEGTVAVMVVALVHTELSVTGVPAPDREPVGVHVTVDPLAKFVPARVSAKWLMPMLAVAPVARVSIVVMAGAALTVRSIVFEAMVSLLVTRTAGVVPPMSDAERIEAVRTVGAPEETVLRTVPLNEIVAPELNPVPFTVSVSAALRLAVV
jgi:hypothetical protein